MEETVPQSPTVDTSSFRTRLHGPRASRRRWPVFTLLLALLTSLSMSFTVFFAYNSSSENPISRKLIFSKPERSILILNLASQITIFCLAELTSSVLETLRWTFACAASGIPVYTFLALSRSTNIVGVLFLLFGGGAGITTIRRDGHRLWGSQR